MPPWSTPSWDEERGPGESWEIDKAAVTDATAGKQNQRKGSPQPVDATDSAKAGKTTPPTVQINFEENWNPEEDS